MIRAHADRDRFREMGAAGRRYHTLFEDLLKG